MRLVLNAICWVVLLPVCIIVFEGVLALFYTVQHLMGVFWAPLIAVRSFLAAKFAIPCGVAFAPHHKTVVSFVLFGLVFVLIAATAVNLLWEQAEAVRWGHFAFESLGMVVGGWSGTKAGLMLAARSRNAALRAPITTQWICRAASIRRPGCEVSRGRWERFLMERGDQVDLSGVLRADFHTIRICFREHLWYGGRAKARLTRRTFMAHELATINGKAAMMYVGEVPWHGLGTALIEPPTAVEAIKAAQLDWEVVKRPVHFKAGSRYRVIPGKHVLARADTLGKADAPVFGIVGEGYTPLQNRDAFAWFDPIVKERAATYHTAGALGDGERVWVLVEMRDHMQIAGDDWAKNYLLLSNSHDGQGSIQVKFTPIRVVCQNTLTMALSSGEGVRISHTRSLPERLELAKENLGIINTRFGQIEQDFKRFAEMPIKDDRLEKYLELVFPLPEDEEDEPARKRALGSRLKATDLFENGRGNRLPKVRGTLWAAYNGVTEFVDYYWTSRKSKEQRLESVWFGSGYHLKARAFDVALAKAREWKNN